MSDDRGGASVEAAVSLGADHTGSIVAIDGVRILRLFLERTWRT
jgi:hypothetical protein